MQLSLTFSVSAALAAASFVPFSQAAPTSYSSTSPDASLEFKRSELVPRDISEISYVLQHIKHRSAKNFASFQANTGTSNPLTDNTAVGDLVQSYINSNTALKRDASIVKERAVNTVQKAKVFAKVKITKQAVASLTSPATVALTQVGDAVFWTGPVAAGTPAQTAQLTIDTGSSDTFFRPGFYNPKLSVTVSMSGCGKLTPASLTLTATHFLRPRTPSNPSPSSLQMALLPRAKSTRTRSPLADSLRQVRALVPPLLPRS